MADLLAEAELPSPWDGLRDQPDFDQLLAKRISDLGPADRMMACSRITEATDQQRRVLMAIAYYGWTNWVSFQALAADTAIRMDVLGRALRQLNDKGILRQTTLHLTNGRRLRLLTISGQYLLLGYHRRFGESAQGNLPPAVFDTQSAQGNLPPAVFDTQSAQGNLPPAQIGAQGNLPSQKANSPTRTLVSSSSYISEDIEQLTNRGPAQGKLPPAPPWWDRFVFHVARIPHPPVRAPKWLELASLLDAGRDPDGRVLMEACAQFLDVYSKPKHSAVRSLRAVVRKIYLGLLDGGPKLYAADTWFSPEPDPQEEPEPEPVSDLPLAPPLPTAADPAAAKLWREVLGDLQSQLPRPTFETWLKNTEGVRLQGETFVAEAPGTFVVEWLERRMHHAMEKTLEKVAGRPLELRLRVRTNPVGG